MSSDLDGDIGIEIPALNTINSPGTAPSAITVGATVNGHILFRSVLVPGGPGNLSRLNAQFGNGPMPTEPLRAPARDVAQLGNDGKACSGLGSGTLNGAIALVLRGDCAFADKVNNAQKAGAVGVILYQASVNSIDPPGALEKTGIPMALIGKEDRKSTRLNSSH